MITFNDKIILKNSMNFLLTLLFINLTLVHQNYKVISKTIYIYTHTHIYIYIYINRC